MGRVHPRHHPVEGVIVDLIGISRAAFIEGHVRQRRIVDPVEEHPLGVEGVLGSGHIELGRRHDGRHGGVHLHGSLQFLAGEVHRHQRKAGGAILPHAHRQHVKGHGDGQISCRQVGPENAVRCHRDRMGAVGISGVQSTIRPQKGVGHQRSKAIVLLHGGRWRGQIAVRMGQHLVIGQAVPGQIRLPHHILPLFHEPGDLRILRHRFVNGDQAVIQQPLFSAIVPREGQAAQILTVGAAGDDIGIVHHQRLRQRGVGMSGDDHVNAVHRLGQLLILGGRQRVPGAAVGQADDDLCPLPL